MPGPLFEKHIAKFVGADEYMTSPESKGEGVGNQSFDSTDEGQTVDVAGISADLTEIKLRDADARRDDDTR